jgi:hypothetical protein
MASAPIEPNGICRSGCKTQDHASYAECLKDARIIIGNLQ